MPGFTTLARIPQRDNTTSISPITITTQTAALLYPTAIAAATKALESQPPSAMDEKAYAAGCPSVDLERGEGRECCSGKEEERDPRDRVGARVERKRRGWIISVCRVVFRW